MPSASDRRAPRVEVALDVFLQTVDGDVPCKTRDASYEGVYIVRKKPLPLRKLIRFRTRLPDTDEELQMLGLVAHTVNATDAAERGHDPGMGIQLFSLGKETRRRWREFVDDLYERDPAARKRIEAAQRPEFRIRIPNEAVLEQFRTFDLPSRSLFIRTPDLHPEGTEVDCIVTHPTIDVEYPLAGVIDEVVEGTVKERGVRVQLELPEEMSDLEEFVGGPVPDEPRAPVPPSAPPPPSGENAIEELSESEFVLEESEAETDEASDAQLAEDPAAALEEDAEQEASPGEDEQTQEPSDEAADLDDGAQQPEEEAEDSETDSEQGVEEEAGERE